MKTNYYVDGNTVRKLHGEPEERRRRAEEARRKKQHRENVRAAKKNQEMARHMNFGYVFFLSLATALVMASSIFYINIQTDVNRHLRTIANLESQVSDLRADNEALERKIATSVDIDTIRSKASNELGMHYASEGQIKVFSVDEGDYMNQYADLD
ncbi:MAG: hypothetical protein K6F37_06520 [Lachnospiraceae bacterium]|nr:hypothetical protein [Lachnospiraceae bacterium]